MNPLPISFAFTFLDRQFDDQEFSEEERIEFLKLMQFAVMIEQETDDEIPPVVLRGFKTLSKECQRLIVEIRNSEFMSRFSLKDELFVYRMLSKIYRHK